MTSAPQRDARLPDDQVRSVALTLARDEHGAAYVEFLLVFPPIFMMFLGMIQAAMMYAANLVVTHAATTASRAAVVVLDDNESAYGDEARNDLTGGGEGESPLDKVDGFLEWAGLGSAAAAPAAEAGSTSGARRSAIRSAASIPLLSVSPSMSQLVGSESVYEAIGGDPAERGLTGAAVYNRTAVAVTFPTERAGTSYKAQFDGNEDVTVRVTYLFHCAVPLVNRIMCDDIVSLKTGVPLEAVRELATRTASGGASPAEIAAMLERVRDGRARLQRASPGVAELDGAESPWLAYLTAVTGARFVILRAEATMPNHGAAYSYVE
jgi:hypothetical protein